MKTIYIATSIHILLAYTLLRIIPSQYAFLADLVAFPTCLFLTLREISNSWTVDIAIKKSESAKSNSGSKPEDEKSSVSSSSGSLRKRRQSGKRSNSVAYQQEKDKQLQKQAPLHRSTTKIMILLVLIQMVSFAFVLDFVYRPIIYPAETLTVFRPGYVSDTTVKLHIRYSGEEKLEVIYKAIESQNTHAPDDEENALNIPWDSSGIPTPTNETDYTVVYKIDRLQPATRYIAKLNTINANNARSSLGSVQFKTAPTPGAPTKYRFATGSCIKPNFPYKPTTKDYDVYGFANILEHHANTLDMFMFLGDFIYADLPFYFGSSAEDYRRLYRQVYLAPSSHELMRKVPMLHVYDDHEILNNWHGQYESPMPNALKAFKEYNGDANPDSPINSYYYNFTYGNVAVYAWDTRRYRTKWESTDDTDETTMLGEQQKLHFFNWLRDVNHTAAVKFVVSSVPLTSGWRNVDSSHDTWRGYPKERDQILGWTKDVPNLFFLSGDRHEMAAVVLPSGNVEFSTSPVSQFTFPVVGAFKWDVEGESTLHYRRKGHVKYGVLDIDTVSDPVVPKVTYSLYTTDEHEGRLPVWKYEALCKPWR